MCINGASARAATRCRMASSELRAISGSGQCSYIYIYIYIYMHTHI